MFYSTIKKGFLLSLLFISLFLFLFLVSLRTPGFLAGFFSPMYYNPLLSLFFIITLLNLSMIWPVEIHSCFFLFFFTCPILGYILKLKFKIVDLYSVVLVQVNSEVIQSIYVFFSGSFPFNLLQDIEYSSLCYTVGLVIYLFYR